ncbi:relaxase/mobilization nuclease domain-containing protein [Vreelandella alkaliphila]|uniref:DNA relaxase n=1 Tax=Vreelandella alkaliphila TaxID=272774 RepID=A0A7C9JSW8_9GAMM|nr:DNA relaxase [Halomonas alkaliphila]NDL70840.1 DNA relaxase [Halomonas alkaliphila]
MNNSGVTVKIVSYACNADQLESDLLFISKYGDVELEDERGLFVFTKEMVRDLARDWAATKPALGKKHRYTTNLVLLTPACIEPNKIKAAAHNFAKREFSHNHQYVLALYEHDRNPHAYLTILNFGFDGRCLRIKRGFIQQLQKSFAAELERREV